MAGEQLTAPRGTAFALGAGAMLVSAMPRAATGAGVSPEILAKLPAITTPGFSFDQKALKIKAGETVALRFENPHSFDIDELNVHVPAPAGRNNLILFKPTQVGTYTYSCSLPGHRAEVMEGTLIVEP